MVLAGSLLTVVLAMSPSLAANGQGQALFLPSPYMGGTRGFSLYLSPTLPNASPVPLVVVLHGLYNSWQNVEQDSGFDALADADGFALAYPYGLGSSWNAGRCCGTSSHDVVDDDGFLAQIVAQASAVRRIDPARVYIAGFSNGGMMALRAVCDRPDVFAAAVSVSGVLETPCPSGRPVSALLINGLRDRTVPYDGLQYSSFLHTSLASVPASANVLARRSNCTGYTTSATATFRDTFYRNCADGTGIEVVAGMRSEHDWPTQSRDGYDATAHAWAFLAAHPRAPSS